MLKSKWLPRIEKHILAGKEIRAGERVIYPIIEVLILAAGDGLLGFRLSPIALLIIEPEMEYAISLKGGHLAVDEIYGMAPYLKDKRQRQPSELHS